MRKEITNQIANELEVPIELVDHFVKHAIERVLDCSDAYQRMMSHNPDLKEHRDEDPRQFTQHFMDLWLYAPVQARNSTMAGTMMRQMSMSPATAGSVIMEAGKRRL